MRIDGSLVRAGRFSGLLPVLVFAILLRCDNSTIPPVTNPHSPGYEGDYAYTLEWIKTDSDTFELFRPYHLQYRTVGSDTFAVFAVTSRPRDILEDAFHDLSDYNWDRSPTRTHDSSVVVYFTDTLMHGTLEVRGMRPNGRSVDTVLSVTVRSPYHIESPDELMWGETGTVSVVHLSEGNLSGAVGSVVWYLHDKALDTLPTTTHKEITADSTGNPIRVSAQIRDTLGNAFRLDTIEIRTVPPGPRIEFSIPTDTIHVLMDKDTTLRVQRWNADSVHWWSTPAELDTSTAGDSLRVLFTTRDTRVVYIRALTADGASSEPDSIVVVVHDGVPRVTKVHIAPNVRLAGDTAYLQVTASVFGANIDTIIVRDHAGRETVFPVTPAPTITDSFPVVYHDIGSYLLSAAAKSDNGRISSFAWAGDSLKVNNGTPVVDDITPDTVYMKQDTAFTIHWTDPDTGEIEEYYLGWGEGAELNLIGGATVLHRFEEPGSYLVAAKVKDDTDKESSVYRDSVVVIPGTPVVTGVTVPETIWFKDINTYTISATDPNDSIETYEIRWDYDSEWFAQDSVTFSYEYLSYGEKQLSVRVRDHHGNEAVRDTTIHVRAGFPSIQEVTFTPSLDEVYVNDTIAVTVTAEDSNEKVTHISVSWDGDGEYELTLNGESVIFPDTVYGTADTVDSQRIRIQVEDTDELFVDTVISFIVRSGAPSVDSVAPDTVWVNDDTTFAFHVHDDHGKVDSILIDWRDGSAPDTLDLTASMSDTAMRHRFPIRETQTYSVQVTAIDDDGVRSARELPILVRKGEPRVVADDAVVHTSAQGVTIDLNCSTSDTNGHVILHEWDIWNDGEAWVSTGANRVLPAQSFAKKTSVDIAVRVTDDDGNTTLDTMTLYVNALPRKAGSPSPPDGTNAGTLSPQLSWDGSDEEDGSDLEYRVWLYPSTASFPTSPLQDWARGDTLSIAELESSKIYNWRVDTRDRHGGSVEGDTWQFFTP